MNPDGDIRELLEDESPVDTEILLSEAEAKLLKTVDRDKRHNQLKIMRAEEKRKRRQQRNLREMGR